MKMYCIKGENSSNKSKCISLPSEFIERLREFALISSERKQNSFDIWPSQITKFRIQKKYEICANMVDLHLYFDGVASCAILVWPVLLGEQKQSKFHVFKPISSSAHKLSRRPRLFLSIHCGQTYHSVNFPIHVFFSFHSFSPYFIGSVS